MRISIYVLHLRHGGVERAVSAAANLLCEMGHRVTIKSTYNLGEPAYQLNRKVRIEYLTDRKPNRTAFRQALKKRRFITALSEGISALKTLYIKKKSLKEALEADDADVLITTRHEQNLELAKLSSKPCLKIGQLHHDVLPQDKRYCEIIEKYTGLDVLTTLTEEQAKEIERSVYGSGGGLHIDYPEIIPMPNFLEDSYFLDPTGEMLRNRARREFSRDTVNFCFVGRLEKEKGGDRLLSAFARITERFPAARLAVAGDGSQREALEQQAADAGIADKVSFKGMLDVGAVRELLDDSDVYLLTSYTEGFGLVLVEASAAALPLIAYDVRTGPRTIIENGVNGYLIPDGNQELFAASAVKLAEEPKLRREMGMKAYELAQRFSASAMGARWQGLLQRKSKHLS